MSAEREVAEESGLQVRAVRLVALFDKLKHDHPPQIPHAYKLFFHCRKIGGEDLRQTNETLDCAYFPVDSLPALSLNRNTPKQIVELTAHITSAAGKTRRIPRSMASATPSAETLPLKESGATTIRTTVLLATNTNEGRW